MPLYFRWSQRPYLLPLYPSLTMMPVLLLQRPSFCSWNMARVFLLQVLCTCCQQWLYWLVLSLIGLLTPVSSPSKLLPWPFQSKQLTPVIALPWFISSVVLIVSWYYLVCVINSLLAASSARMWTESSDFAFVTSGSPLPRIGILKRVSGSPKENSCLCLRSSYYCPLVLTKVSRCPFLFWDWGISPFPFLPWDLREKWRQMITCTFCCNSSEPLPVSSWSWGP
jgi:hypothetical protein